VQNAKLKVQNQSSKLKVNFGGEEEVAVHESTLPDSKVSIYFLENKKYLSGGGVYFSKDAFVAGQEEIKRFAFFSKAVASFLHSSFFIPHSPFGIVHCHDWHTGLVPGLLKTGILEGGKTDILDLEFLKSRFLEFSRHQGIKVSRSRTSRTSNFKKSSASASVFTIHNLANQGFAELGLLKNLDSITSESELIKWDAEDDNLDLMLQGITNADVISTVSPTYAKEILTPAFGEGLHQVLKARESRLYGILNGIDYEVWNPEADAKIEFNYGLKEGLAGKVGNKIYLQKKLDLKVNPEVPLIGIVNRLAEQKGLGLLLDALEGILGLGCQLVILGVGDSDLEQKFKIQNSKFKTEGNFVFVNRFDEDLAHQIYAAADFFMMPSKFEPCGLVQIIAMRYGALPIVRATGGLKDTVKDGETGFVFKEYSAEALLEAVERAVSRFGVENIQFRQMVARAMRQDFSWDASAREYLQLYQRAVEYKNEASKIS